MPVLAPLWSLVEDSFDEASFLWGRWEAELDSPSRSLADVVFWVEERLLGALDGVRSGGARAQRELALRALEGGDRRETSVASFVLGSSLSDREVRDLAERLPPDDPSRIEAMARGMELAATDLSLARCESVFDDVDDPRAVLPLRVRAGLAAPPSSFVMRALGSKSPLVRAAAFQALRYAGDGKVTERDLMPGLSDAQLAVRDAALETGLILGASAAWKTCVEAAGKAGPDDGVPLLYAAMLGQPEDHRHVYRAVEIPETRSLALEALAVIGTEEAMAAILGYIGDEKLGALAAESFCATTGLSLEREKLVLPPAEEEGLPEFESDDLDADLVPTALELLPRADPAGLLSWWSSQLGRFSSQQRYVAGEAFGPERLQDVLLKGPTRRRHNAARELAVRTFGHYQVATRAFSARQRDQMRGFASLPSRRP